MIRRFFGSDHLYFRDDSVRRAEVEHLLRLGDTTD
jgi:hypothetical protein